MCDSSDQPLEGFADAFALMFLRNTESSWKERYDITADDRFTNVTDISEPFHPDSLPDAYPPTPPTPPQQLAWEQPLCNVPTLAQWDDPTPPNSPTLDQVLQRAEQVDQIPSPSDSCKVVNYEGVTYVEINGYLYPIDAEFSEPVSVPVEEHPRPSRKSQRAERLWEFLLRLLKDSKSNPSMIQWVDQNVGTFRLTNSKSIAQLWGRRKSNDNMTYEKLSRAMRYYYSRNILRPVLGKKLVYSFGPKAKGWRPHETA